MSRAEAIRTLYAALNEYQRAFREERGKAIAEDDLIGGAWAQLAVGLVSLLDDSELGDLDRATMDLAIRVMVSAAGFPVDWNWRKGT